MAFSICLIEDRIPVQAVDEFDATARLNVSTLNFLLKQKQGQWTEAPVKSMVEELLKLKDSYGIFAFINPSFYFKCYENEGFAPDIIILDWDFGAAAETTESYLLKILETSFCFVNIFTGVDAQGDIEKLLATKQFKPYLKERIQIIHKEDQHAIENVLKVIKEKTKNNFSFRFGNKLRSDVAKSIDQVLVSLGRIPLDDLVRLLGENNEETKKVTLGTADLVSFITERLKNDLNANKLDMEIPVADLKDTLPEDIVEALWSYRLYFSPQDDFVWCGDIVDKDGERYLVISAPCDLQKFWRKNYGFINLVPLSEIKKDAVLLKKLSFAHDKDSLFNQVSGITNGPEGLADGVFVLSFVPVIDTAGAKDFVNYLVFSKEICSKKIEVGAEREVDSFKKIKLYNLRYKDWVGYKRLCTLSEPFLSPLVSKILQAIAGTGASDYSKEVSKILVQRCKKACKDG